ncbi:MAG TPA: hypothetical protein VF142_15130 [Longimicrobium sp.]
MHRIRVQAAPLLAALVLSSACASGGVQPGQAGHDDDCENSSAVLVVRNQSGGEVQIVETRIGSGGRTVVTTLGPGRHEVRIRNEPGYAYAAERVGGGATLAVTSRPRAGDRAVTLERECRSS